MDPTLLCTDDQTATLPDRQSEDLVPLPPLHSPTGNMASAYETGAEAASTESSTNVSQGKSSIQHWERPPLSTEPAQKHEDFDVCDYFGSSEPALPLLPHFSHDLMSPLCESFSEVHIKERALSLPLIQDNSESQPSEALSSTWECPSDPEPLSATNLFRSLSHQSDSLESDAATAPVSDLYIFESETQDFIMSPSVDPHEIQCPEYQTLSQNPDFNTHVLMCDSDRVLTQCHLVDDESDLSQNAKPGASDACEAGLMSVNDEGRGKPEVRDVTPQARRGDSPMELWLDACQYLDMEDVLEKTGHSVTQGGLNSDLSFPPGETQVSGFSPDGSEGIGWASDDTRGWGPPVERWSSVDSWASALSEWTGIIAAPPEDFTAAFTEIGAEIDALTQALEDSLGTETFKEGKGQEPPPAMGVQDQPLETQNTPVLSGQSCLSLCLEAAGPELPDRDGSRSVESLCESTAATQEEKEEIQSHPAAGSSPGGLSSDVVPGGSADLDLSLFGGFVDSDIFTSEDPVVLSIIEDTDLEPQNTPGELIIKEPFGDEVCEVTDLGSLSQQEARRSSGPTEDHPEGPEPSADLQSLNTLTDSHVPGVHTPPGRQIHVHTHVSSDTGADLDGAGQVERRPQSPEFIMPLAPLSVGSSLVCRTSCSLEGDQTSLNDNRDSTCDQPCVICPTLGGITDITPLEGDELTSEEENIRNSSEKSSSEEQLDFFTGDSVRKTLTEEIHELNRELSSLTYVPADHFFISQESRVAVITLDINDPFVPRAAKPIAIARQNQKTAEKMPHKTHKSTSESRARSKKDKPAAHHHGVQAAKKQESLSHHVSAQQVCKQQETRPPTGDSHTSENTQIVVEDKEAKLVIEAEVATPHKPHGKKKKKHAANATAVKTAAEPLVEVENGAKQKTAKGRIDMFEAKLGAKAQKESEEAGEKQPQLAEAKAKAAQGEKPHADHKDHQPKNDDVIKRRRLSEDKFGKIVSALESKIPKPDVSKVEEPKVDVGAARRKAYSEVVKQKIPPKEDIQVVQPIQAVPVSGDPQSLCLWCQFTAVASNHTVTWRTGGSVLSEAKRSAGDESRASLTISNASHKDLGKYECQLSSSQGSVSLDYVLTYEVLSEIVIPPTPKTVSAAPVDVLSEEEDVHCSRLIFKEDFLSDQCFGENQPASIITEKVHFGEGMHRRAFRTKMHAGQIPLLLPGHACVLKVHNAISYGTKNNDELVKKNFALAVEECQVQNTAREYIKAYTTVAQSTEAFGDVPEIIPIYLVHRPSNDIPYATLEEELIGDFVKYSVKDGKEINLMRRDSEAGQKCCAFQHWVYHKTEGNLLVTDMQGVGMRLTDVGIATCKKGYKGFKGNCATSFIDQFKALHQCNQFCEILGLKSLQPKPKKPAPKPKAQPSAAPKKKMFGPTVKDKL